MTHDPIGILFDLDGVLVDTESLYYRAYSAVLAEHGVSVTPDVYSKRWIQAGTGAEWAVKQFKLPMTAQEMKERKQPIYDHLVETELRTIPGAADCVRRLSAEFPCVLATNSFARNVEHAMRLLGVRDQFKDLVTKERFARPKPAPDAFVAGVAALGLPARRCVVIEDAEKGLVAALSAGTRCVIAPCSLTRGGDFAAADRVVGTLGEITPALVREVVSLPRIRVAREDDRGAIFAIHRAAIERTCARSYAPEHVAAWLAARTDPSAYPLADSLFVVAEDGDGVHAFGELAARDREVRAVYVHPDRGGRGLGAMVLGELERRARRAHIETAELSSTTNAVGFYERHGWKRLRDEQHTLRTGVPIPCVRMSKQLS